MERKAPRRTALLALALGLTAAIAATTAFAGPSHKASPQKVSPLCKTGGVGFASVLSGPAAALGLDQLNWAKVFLLFWNENKPR